MMLVHMEVHLKGYFLMSISLQKYTVCPPSLPSDVIYGRPLVEMKGLKVLIFPMLTLKFIETC